MSGRGAHHVVGAVAFALVALALPGCGNDDEAPFAAVAVPNCASVKRFGNGSRCDLEVDPVAGVPADGINACGAGVGGICASGWLCFDAAKVAFCGCSVDSDCQGRAAYINQARAGRKIAPMPARCEAGRCAGAP